jgi:DNA helicase-2/ATP-dependent DNA helicase PcrA
MTSSKGLEFDVVLILGVDEESVPDYLSLHDSRLLAEDRRKLYVSITRARDEVRILYSGFVVTKNG